MSQHRAWEARKETMTNKPWIHLCNPSSPGLPVRALRVRTTSGRPRDPARNCRGCNHHHSMPSLFSFSFHAIPLPPPRAPQSSRGSEDAYLLEGRWFGVADGIATWADQGGWREGGREGQGGGREGGAVRRRGGGEVEG